MSFTDESELMAFIGRDAMLPMLTGEAMEEALRGFALPLVPGKDWNWLAMAVRRALAMAMDNVEDGPSRTSNAEIRAELERLRALTSSTWTDLFGMPGAVDSRIWEYSWRNWDGEGGIDIGDGMRMGDPTLHVRFRSAIAELDWLAGFLRDVARATDAQLGPWRMAEQRRLRVERGQWLAPIFESAFGRKVSANNFGNGDSRHRNPTPFMEFYRRVLTLAFGATETTNLSEVVKEACRHHRFQPAEFAPGVIPGL